MEVDKVLIEDPGDLESYLSQDAGAKSFRHQTAEQMSVKDGDSRDIYSYNSFKDNYSYTNYKPRDNKSAE